MNLSVKKRREKKREKKKTENNHKSRGGAMEGYDVNNNFI